MEYSDALRQYAMLSKYLEDLQTTQDPIRKRENQSQMGILQGFGLILDFNHIK